MPLREPLKWTGGIRESASGLIVEIHTDEGLVGIGEAPGPTLPTIQTIIDREFAQFLVDQDPLRIEWIVHRLEEYSRNWAGIAAYAIAGVEMALLDLKGKALGVLRRRAARRLQPRVGAGDRLPLHRRAGGERAEGGRLRRRGTHGAEAQGRARPRQDHDSIAAIRDRVGYDVKLRIDANMNWSVPAAIKWIRALERYDLQYVEQPVPDFDLAGMAQVRRSVSMPIAADESCTSLRSALELIKADACDVFVVYPSEAGGLTRAMQIGALAAAAGKWCAIGSWAELGVATTANAHVAAASTSFPFANDTHYPLQLNDVLTDAVEIERRHDHGFPRSRSRVSPSMRRAWRRSPRSSSASRRSTTTSRGRPECRPDHLSRRGGVADVRISNRPPRDLLKQGRRGSERGAVAAGSLGRQPARRSARRRFDSADAEERRNGHLGARAGSRAHRPVRRDPHDHPHGTASRCTSRCSSGTRTSTSAGARVELRTSSGLEDDHLQHPAGHQVLTTASRSRPTTSSTRSTCS